MNAQEPVTLPPSNSDRDAPGRRRFFGRICQWLRRPFSRSKPAVEAEPEAAPKPVARPAVSRREGFEPVERVRLTQGVVDTLFGEYRRHRGGRRGNEEIGWLLLGVRERDHVVVRATLPAGTQRDAGKSHVRFNTIGQVIGSRIVREQDRRITPVGVAHTHPGNLREPSKGDYKGDLPWVERLRGEVGVFAIGTFDGENGATSVAEQLTGNVQYCEGLAFRWYSLRARAAHYETLEANVIEGEDLAAPLHPLWPTIEEHAPRLERLYHQLAGVQSEVANPEQPTLMLTLPLLEEKSAVKVLLQADGVRYLVEQNGDLCEVDGLSEMVDQATYLLLAELAGRC